MFGIKEMILIMPQLNLERLKLARESRGLNQTELNEITGLPITSISKAERSELTLSADALARIAEATKYPLSFFTAPGGAAADSLAWRRREKVPQKIFTILNAKIDILRLQVQTLTRELGIHQHSFPYVDLNDTFRPADVAKWLRATWGVPQGPITNLTLLLEDKEVPVASFDFGSERIDSRATITEDRYPLICVNSTHTGDRQRWSLAYQLGHLLMHTYRAVSPEQDVSREANQFAAELLVPEAAYRADIGDNTITMALLANMKRKWGVSMIALLYRADDLGYTTPEQKAELVQRFNALRLRRREPIALDVPIEQPCLIRTWVDSLRRRQRLSAASLASRLHLLPEEFQSQFN
jgi:Zn-dependent peptidase ImmA (M78 family)/transcriptional regulator with XRE-family HTH domain